MLSILLSLKFSQNTEKLHQTYTYQTTNILKP